MQFNSNSLEWFAKTRKKKLKFRVEHDNHCSVLSFEQRWCPYWYQTTGIIFHGPDLHWYDPECLAWHWHWNTWKRKKRGSHWILIADRYNSYNRYESCEKSNTPQLASSVTDKARTPTREQRVEGARSTDGGWRWSTASGRWRSLNGDHWLALFDQSPFNALVGDQRLSYYRQWKVCLQAKAGATVVDQNPDYDQMAVKPW